MTTIETTETTARDVAFEAFARSIEACFGAGSWRLAPDDVCRDASSLVVQVTVSAGELDDASWTLAKLAKMVKDEHGYRFTAIALTVEEPQPA